MKKIILMAALVVGGTAFGQTQTEKAKTIEKKKSVELSSQNVSTKTTIEREVDALTNELKLTEEQQSKTKDLFKLREETYSKMPDLDSATKMEYDKKFESEFRTFLTPEQTKKLDELKVREDRKMEVSPVKKQPTERKMTN